MDTGGFNQKQCPLDLAYSQTGMPPAYQENDLPISKKEPEPVVIIEKHEPIIIQQRVRPKKSCKNCGRFACCCGSLVCSLLICVMLLLAFVTWRVGWWHKTDVHLYFTDYPRSGYMDFNVGDTIEITCDVETNSWKTVPLVQWYYDPNNPDPAGITTYEMFAVHDQITNPNFTDRFEIIRTVTKHSGVLYTMVIKDAQKLDSGYYGCQAPKPEDDFTNAFQCDNEGNNDSGNENESFDGDDIRTKSAVKYRKWCFDSDRSDYVYAAVGEL